MYRKSPSSGRFHFPFRVLLYVTVILLLFQAWLNRCGEFQTENEGNASNKPFSIFWTASNICTWIGREFLVVSLLLSCKKMLQVAETHFLMVEEMHAMTKERKVRNKMIGGRVLMMTKSLLPLCLGRLGKQPSVVVFTFVGNNHHWRVFQAPFDVFPCRAAPHAAAFVVSPALFLQNFLFQ